MPRPKAKIAKVEDMPKEPTKTLKEEIAEKAEATIIEKGLPSPVISKEILEKNSVKMVVYEAKIDGKTKYFPATTVIPRYGKYYGIRTFEDDNRTRILMSQKDYNESFPFSDGPVMTKFGLDTGKTCNITIKLVDVLLDVTSERIIGVYFVLMTPSFAKIDVDAIRLVKELESKDVMGMKEEILTHEALMLKFQLEEAMKQAETYRKALFERADNITKLAEDFAAPIIETTLSSLSATRDMFDKYWESKEEYNFWKENWKMIIGLGLFCILGLALYFLGPWARR